ncbi:MAG TPA: VWD domain-containing protein, partial [Kofleriaceae bacterium]
AYSHTQVRTNIPFTWHRHSTSVCYKKGPSAQTADSSQVAASTAVEGARQAANWYGPSPSPGDVANLAHQALQGLPAITREEVTNIAALQCMDGFSDGCNDREREFWDHVREQLNGDGRFDDLDGLLTAAGDPHLRTADGVLYDLQIAGEVTFMRSLDDSFEIQLRLEPWTHGVGVSSITAVALRAGRQNVMVDSRPIRARVDGAELKAGRSVLDDGTVVTCEESSCAVVTPRADHIQILSTDPQLLHIAVNLASSRKGKIEGLSGNFNGSPADDARPRGAAKAEPLDRLLRDCAWTHEVFGNSWRVDPKTSLFTYQPGHGLGSFAAPTFPSCGPHAIALDDKKLRELTARCAAAGLSGPLRESCIRDMRLTGLADMAAAYGPAKPAGVCGNGTVDLFAGESCDDGNQKRGDGCDDHCRVEPGASCSGMPSACAPTASTVPLPYDPAREMPAYSLTSNADLALATSATVIVDARSDIFSSALHEADKARSGVLPARVTLKPDGAWLTFDEVRGAIGCEGNASFGADGGTCAGPRTNLSTVGPISGIVAEGRTLFLVGVFTSETAGKAPKILELKNAAAFGFSEANPAIGQTFFVGDGLTGTGTGAVQRFKIPAGATRLYLGFADGFGFVGAPGAYGDNRGALSVRVAEH